MRIIARSLLLCGIILMIVGIFSVLPYVNMVTVDTTGAWFVIFAIIWIIIAGVAIAINEGD